MNDFDWDVLQKKRTAQSAKHKVASVRGPSKCTLPSDHLTDAQRRKLNGPVEEFVLGKPMDWGTFKSMPADLRKQHLIDLRTKYAANAMMLGAMFGVNNQTVLNQQKELGIPPMSRGAHASRAARARWQAFVGVAAEETACQEQAAEDATKAEEPAEPTPEETTERMTLDCFTACMASGRYSPEAMLAILGTMPIPEGKCRIKIEVTKV